MVAAAGTGVSAVDHELLGGKSSLARLFVKKLGALNQLIPGGGRLDVNLDHPRIRSNAEIAQTRVARWLIAFQQYRAMQLLGGGFDGGDQFQIVLDPLQWRHEQVQPAFSRFGAESGAGQPVGGLVDLWRTLV